MASAKLFVGNLSTSTGAQTIGKLFESVGIVKNATIAVADGVSRGFGYVEMDTPDLAQKIVAQYNGYDLEGRKLRVEIARGDGTPRDPTMRGERRPRRPRGPRPFGGAYPPMPYGDAGMYQPRGYRGNPGWYPAYPPMYSGWGAYPPMGGFGGPGRARRPRARRPRRVFDATAPLSGTRIHVSNLPFSLKADELRAAFAKFKVKDVTLAAKRFNPELNVGYGFVEFTTPAEQKKALEAFPQITLKDRECKVHAALEKPATPVE